MTRNDGMNRRSRWGRVLPVVLHAVLSVVFSVSLAGCQLFSFKPIPPPQKRAPNFIIILLDDLGVHDLGATGNDFIETPAIDRLAKEGVLFTHAYANAPNCAPSRAALMSGQYATRTGVYTMMSGDMGEASKRPLQTPPNRVYLLDTVYTLAELLHDNGYATAHIGKWNLGTGPVRGPTGQGFDINIGGYRGGPGETADAYFAPYIDALPGLQVAPAGEYLTDRLNQEAVTFIEHNSERPFFLYLSHFAPHFPIIAPAATREKYEQKRAAACGAAPTLRFCDMSDIYPAYAAMIEHVDRGVARIREVLAERNLADNTIIVLTSDNGGYALAADPLALRGNKSQLYEGGIRVPMIWSVPGTTRAGKGVELPVSLVDVYPTFAALAGIDVGLQTLDGEDLSPLLATNRFAARPLSSMATAPAYSNRALYWYLPGYTLDTTPAFEDAAGTVALTASGFSQTPAAVIQKDGWKLIRYYDGSPPELYHLVSDENENRDLYEMQPDIAALLMADLEAWLRNTGGLLALPDNPAYRPGKR